MISALRSTVTPSTCCSSAVESSLHMLPCPTSEPNEPPVMVDTLGELLQLSKSRRVGVIGAAGIVSVHDLSAALHRYAKHLLQLRGGEQLAHVAMPDFRAKRAAGNGRYFAFDPVDSVQDSAERGQYQHQNNAADDQKCLAGSGRLWRLRGRWLGGLGCAGGGLDF